MYIACCHRDVIRRRKNYFHTRALWDRCWTQSMVSAWFQSWLNCLMTWSVNFMTVSGVMWTVGVVASFSLVCGRWLCFVGGAECFCLFCCHETFSLSLLWIIRVTLFSFARFSSLVLQIVGCVAVDLYDYRDSFKTQHRSNVGSLKNNFRREEGVFWWWTAIKSKQIGNTCVEYS